MENNSAARDEIAMSFLHGITCCFDFYLCAHPTAYISTLECDHTSSYELQENRISFDSLP